MVKKAKWLKNVKKAFSQDLKKSKHESVEYENSEISYPVLIATSRSSPPQFEVRVDEIKNYDQKKNLSPVSPDSETVTDTDHVLVDSPPSSPESVHQPVILDRFPGKSKEEASSILIQTIFRGYLARRELRAMRGLARLELFMEGPVVKRQAATTLKCMQTLSRLQSEIRSRRILMSEENQARHKLLLQKHAKELGGLKKGGNWNYSNQSKEQVEASSLNKSEATMRRERGLAYAFTHQQTLKSNSKSENPMFMDPSNPTWGWSALERWMAGHPCESSEKEQNNKNNETSSVKTSSTNRNSHGGETAKSSNRNKLKTTTQPNTPSSSSTTARNPRKNRPNPSPIKSKSTDDIKSIERNHKVSIARSSVSDDAKSSERKHKHSIARSSVSDDESVASSTTRRINKAPIRPARGKLKVQTSLTITAENGVVVADKAPARGKLKVQSSLTTTGENGVVVADKAPVKKRISISASPAPKPRRSSAPPKVENGLIKAEKTP